MHRTTDYRDFIQKLVEEVSSNGDQDEITEFAVILAHSTFNQDDEVWELVIPICETNTVLKHWFFWNNQEVAPWDKDREELQNAIKYALETNPEEWILLHLYLIAAWLAPEWVETHKYIDHAKSLLKESPELHCFSPYLDMFESWISSNERDIENLLNHYDRMLQVAIEYDDAYWIAESIRLKATTIRDSKPNDTLSLLEESFRMFMSLGIHAYAGNVAKDIGAVYTTLGEYDAAIEFLVEDVDMSSKSLIPGKFRSATIASFVAGVFCDLDQPDQAYEWIKWYSESLDGTSWTPPPIIELSIARTLIQLGRIEEGTRHLDLYYKQALESGFDSLLTIYNFVLGLREFQVGNLGVALSIFEQSFKEAERLKMPITTNRCLLALAKTEREVSISESWIDKLGEHARSNNYPGIKMQHALLKAECQIDNGEVEDARFTLQDALTYTDSPGVKTLRRRIQDKLDELSR